jgi:succinate dehydrogenase/fumarate reductase cytochrome b subunit
MFTFPRSLFDGVHFSRLAYPETTMINGKKLVFSFMHRISEILLPVLYFLVFHHFFHSSRDNLKLFYASLSKDQEIGNGER